MATFSKRQLQIIDAAIKLIAKGGIQKLTIKNLSDKIGITEPAIYRHFKNKTDLLVSILAYFESNTKSLFKKVHTTTTSPLKQLETIFLLRCKEFSSNPSLATTIFSEEMFINDKKLSSKVFTIINLHQTELSEIINRGQKNSEIRSDIIKKQLTFIILGALRLLVTRWRLSNYSFDIKREGKKLWSSIKKLISTNK